MIAAAGSRKVEAYKKSGRWKGLREEKTHQHDARCRNRPHNCREQRSANYQLQSHSMRFLVLSVVKKLSLELDEKRRRIPQRSQATRFDQNDTFTRFIFL